MNPRDERAWARKRAQEDRLAAAFAGFMCAAVMIAVSYVAYQVAPPLGVILGMFFLFCFYGTYLHRRRIRAGREADLDLLRDATELLGPTAPPLFDPTDVAPSKPKPPTLRADESEF